MHELHLCQAEKELLTTIFPLDVSEADETSKEANDLVTWKLGKADDLVQRLAMLHDIKQAADVVIVGDDAALRLLRLPPKCEVDGRCQDVLVLDADVGSHQAFFILSKDGTLGRRRHGAGDNGASLHMIGVEHDAGFWLAELKSCLMHHKNLLFRADTRKMPVIAHTNEQASTIGIGKSRHRFRQLAGIGNTIFEVLLLVLAFTDEAEKITLAVHRKDK